MSEFLPHPRTDDVENEQRRLNVRWLEVTKAGQLPETPETREMLEKVAELDIDLRTVDFSDPDLEMHFDL